MMQHWIGEAGRDQPHNNVRAAVSVDRGDRKEGYAEIHGRDT